MPRPSADIVPWAQGPPKLLSKAFNFLDEAHPPVEDDLLSSKATDLVTSRITFHQMKRYYGLAKLTHKINHRTHPGTLMCSLLTGTHNLNSSGSAEITPAEQETELLSELSRINA